MTLPAHRADGGRVRLLARGAVSVTPRATGVPKFGVPSVFQVNFCALVVRFMSQPPPVELLAW